jgi:hypothetical protein
MELAALIADGVDGDDAAPTMSSGASMSGGSAAE